MERIDANECIRLLEIEDVGRLALVQGTTPAIFPVNYVMYGGAIVFRTALGSKLLHGRGTPAAFEIDSLDRDARSAWSVVVTGRLEEVAEAEPGWLSLLDELPLKPWAGGEKDHWMRLVPGLITGRRVGPVG
jgi:nitroimidazol reductase NimA-like FMN-containing flavoprotein (pyridoxamine 5'-phosphate oxidase superfamily)